MDNRYTPFPPNASIEDKMADVAAANAAKLASLDKSIAAAQQRAVALKETQTNSWAGRMGLDTEDFLGSNVNRVASLVSGASRMVGNTLALPFTMGGAAAEIQGTNEDVDAFNRYRQGVATPQDMELLQRPVEQPSFAAAKAGGFGPKPASPTMLELLTRGQENRTTARDINEAFDRSAIVHQGRRLELSEDLAAGFQDNVNKITEGWSDAKKGEYWDATKGIVSGLADILVNTGSAVASNPGAVSEYVVENIPQLFVGAAGAPGRAAMLASNAGYAADYYQQGIEQYSKDHNGDLPDMDTRRNIAGWAASLAVAEQLGDVVSLKAASALGKDAAGSAFKNVLRAATTGAVAEGATEAYQTFAEGQAAGKDVSAFDIYQGGVIGAASGGALSGGGRAVAEVAQATPEHAEARLNKKEQAEAFSKAVEENDPTQYLDKENKLYNPETAAGVLFTHNQQEDTTPEVRKENHQKAIDIFDKLDEELSGLIEQRKTATKAEAKELDKQIEIVGKQQDEVLAVVKEMTSQMNAIPSQEEVKLQVEQANSPEAQEAAPAVEQVINLSMQNTSAVSAQDAQTLASNQDNTLTPLQRDYLNAFSEARQTEDQLAGMAKVSQEILTGSSKPGGNVGIVQYRDRITNAMTAGREDVATKQLSMLEQFATRHLSKAKAAIQGLKEQGLGVVIKQTEAGTWEVAPAGYKATNRDMTINSARLAQNMQIEAKALTNAHAEMQKAMALQFGKEGVQSESSAVPVTPTAPTATPTLDAQTQEVQVPEYSSQEGEKQEARLQEIPVEPLVETQPEVTAQPAVAEAKAPAVQVTTAEGENKGLSLYTEKTPSGEVKPYQERNLVADYVVQKAGKETGSQRPLVQEPGFLSKLKTSAQDVARQYLKTDSLTDQQAKTLDSFTKKASEWMPKITGNFLKGKETKYRYKDLTQTFLDDKGQADENVQTAIAYAAFSWVAENAARSAINSDDEINAILGNEEGALVSTEARNALGKAGTRENVVANALGQRIVQALGLASLSSTPKNLIPQLESHLGAHALKLLLDEGVLQRTTVAGDVFAGLTGKAATSKHAKQKFITLVRDTAGNLSSTGQDIRTAMKGSQGILDKLFGAEAGLKEPSQSKIPFTQKTTRNTDQKVPSNLARIMAHENAQPNFVRQDMWQLMGQLHPEVALAIAGFESINEAVTHVVNQQSIQAKNDGLLREYDNMMDYFNGLMQDDKLEDPMYFDHVVWKQQRVGIATNMINPQTSKLHRHMLARPSWTTEVRYTDPVAMQNFKLRVAEGLGIKTDKQDNQKSLAEVATAINKPEIKAAIKVLRKAITLGGLTREDQDILAAGVAKGGEAMHTLDVLMAMAHYMEGIANQKDSFTTQLMGEVDGVTNGPMLSHLLFGAATSVEQLFRLLNRGGFYEQNNDHNQYNQWRAEQGNLDLYEITSLHMVQAIEQMQIPQATANALYSITGQLAKDDKVTKEGRNIIKTPLTAMVFGSSVNNSVDSMADKFIESVYAKMEDVAAGKADRVQVLKDLSQLGVKLPLNTSVKDLMTTPLTTAQIEQLKGVFKNTIGKAVAATMEKDFAPFIEQRRTFNLTAQMAYDLYHAAYTGLREQRLADLIKSGEVAVNPTTGKPIQDLTAKQEAALRKEVQDILPLMHTAFSQESGELDAGILAAKSSRKLSDQSFYEGEVKFGTPFADGAKSVNTRAYERDETNPGVAMAPMSVHSTDSYISHTAAMKSEVLNIHDAHGAGLGNFQQAAQNLNQATWEAMLKYSPANQMAATLTRVIEGVAAMQEAGKLPATSQNLLQDVLAKYATKLDTPAGSVLDIQVKAIKDVAHAADDMKLQAMERMAAVDQYALEGGNYVVTDADRRAAKKARVFLTNEVSDKTQEALATLSALASGAKKVQAQQDIELDSVPELHVPDIPVAVALQLMEGMGPNMKPVREALELGEDLTTAFSHLASDVQVTRLAQLEERYAAWQAAQTSPWGELGAAAILSDKRLVDAFNHDPVMKAKQAMKVLREAINGNQDNRNNVFAGRLLTLLEKTVPADMQVRMVSPNTPASDVLAKGADRSRGWYVSKGNDQAVYVLSPEFKHSGLTVESLLHELTHAALARTVQGELDAQAKDSTYSSDALALVKDLEELRSLAAKYIADHKLNQFAPAVKDVHELISWGMSNLEFQREVMNKVSMQSKTTGNKLVQGMKLFIEKLTGLLFKGSTKSAQEQMENGMAVLIANVSGLFHASAQTKTKVDLVLNQINNQNGTVTYNTLDVFEALGNMSVSSTPVSPAFQVQLKTLLTSIVDKLFPAYGSFTEAMMKDQSVSPVDVYTKALQTGQAPFASKSLAAGFRITDQEAYVLEQVEATVRAALEDKGGHTTAAYKELTKLYQEAYAKLKVKDFHQGDWALATPQEQAEAKALYDFVFAIEQDATGASNYLARFAALGLAHERVSNLLNFATKVSVKSQQVDLTFTEKLHDMFDRAMVWLNGRLTHTFAGQQADVKLETLVQQLVQIESKKRMVLSQASNRIFDNLEGTLRTVTEAGRKKLEAFGQSNFFQKSTKPFIQATGTAISTVAGDRVDMLLDAINNIRDTHFKERQGLLAGIVNEIRGANDSNMTFHELSRVTKKIEGDRKDLITNVAKFTLESFDKGGEYLTPEQKAAVSQVFLRTDMATLLDQYTMAELTKLVNDPQVLNKAIFQHEQTLKGFQNFGHYFIRASKQLGYFKVTGKLSGPNTVFNAGNIARLYGTPYVGRIQEAMAQQAIPTIDTLVSLYALKYVSPEQLKEAKDVLATENKRTQGNGIEMILKLHKDLQKQSKERLFATSEALHMKGYTPEITNPHVEIVVGGPNEKDGLIAQGYQEVSPLALDKGDPDNSPQILYMLRDGGLQNYLSGNISLTSRGTKGSKIHNGNVSLLSAQGLANVNTMQSIEQYHQKEVRDMFKTNPGFDPSQVVDSYMAPVLNPSGEVVNYRYMMQDKIRDTLLERDNRFERLLGVMAGSIFDKEVSVEQNARVVQALKDQYDEDHTSKHYLDRSKSYREVGPRSPDPEMREIWRMLPESTKQSVRKIWGRDHMMVRLDLLDINFGYRKLSISSVFEKDHVLESGIEKVIHEIGTFLFQDKARLRTRQFEEIWQAFVREAKDTLVVKSGVTLLGNISSNITELFWFGVPLTEILRHHKVAIQGAMAYRRDSEELARIKLQLTIDYLPQANKRELEQQQKVLQDALVKNPVHNLIQAGLMPTIVDDVSMDDDLYSYKNRFTRKVDDFIDQLNPHVVEVAKTAVLAHDTPLYKGLAYATQLSDFVARYTLYQHMTQRKVDPMDSKAALQLVSDAFINYDIPSHRVLQYANDMGFVYFTKYYLRIQKTIMHLYRDKPGRALMLAVTSGYLDGVPTLMDSQAINRLGNPFSTGALKYVTSLDEMATVTALMTPFK